MSSLIKNLISEDESLYLEFKYEWYWQNNEAPKEREWGEFLKDFIALVNCDIQYVEESKYLIIGINEDEQELGNRIINTNLNSTLIPTIDHLKNMILQKLNTFFRSESNTLFTYDNFLMNYHTINNKQILVFEIKPSRSLIILKKDLLDKKRTEKENNVFIRGLKENNEPEVLNASPEILDKLSKKINNYRSMCEKEDKKEKSIEKTINLYVQNNNIFSLGNPTKERIWKDKSKSLNILYELYPVQSDFVNIDFIYIYDKTNQIKTYEYLKNEKILTLGAQRYILIADGLKKDIKGIQTKFEAEKVFTLDEFALEYLYKDYLNESIYHDGNFKKQRQVKNFIEPFTTKSSEKNAFIILSEWFSKVSKPLVVIKGYGGVGKTTLVRYFLDDLYSQNRLKSLNSKILFIDSKEIINEISRQGQVDNVFDFYEALAKKKQLVKVFNKELLELSIDNGNLLIVLDGIDEVIAKLGSKFNVDTFIKTIFSNYSMGNEKTKIIITCRDYFWDNNINTDYPIDTIELKAFSLELAKKLFLKQFELNSKEYNKCLEYSKEFALSSERYKGKEDVYIPYILDVIMDMVKQNKELGTVNKNDISSNILNSELTNDYFIGRICNREIGKLKTLTIDTQLKFFMNMATKFNGIVPEKSVDKLFRGLSVVKTNDLIEKFKGHTLIEYINNTFYFRYDFFREYFMNLEISEFFILRKDNNISDDLKDIITEYIRYDNSFTEFVCKRISYDEELQLFIIDIINKFIISLKIEEDIEIRKIISSLIILLLVSLRQSNEKNDIETRTTLLYNIFGKELEFLSLINLFGEENNTKYPTFDFKDKTIIHAWFENYEYFFESKFNNKTNFYKSTFKHLKPRKGITIPKFHNNLFIDCDTLGIEEILNNEENDKLLQTDILRNKLFQVFRHFEQSGNFKEKLISNTRKKNDTNILDILIVNKVISPYRNPEKPTLKQYKIADEYYEIVNILAQRGTCAELEKILKMF